MSEIDSPYVVKLKDATKTNNFFYLAMEICNGGNLKNFVNLRGGCLLEQEARLIFGRIVKGLAAIKAQNVVHRDLKMDNIVLNFKNIDSSVCQDKKFDLNHFIATFDFE